VAELLEKEGVKDVVLVAGGTIPDQDIEHLKSLGFRRVFTPGTPFTQIAAALDEELANVNQTGSGAAQQSS